MFSRTIMDGSHAPAAALDTLVPAPPSERGAWLLAITLGALGLAVLLGVLTGLVASARTPLPASAPPAVRVVVPTPVPSAVRDGSGGTSPVPSAGAALGGQHSTAAIVGRPSRAQRALDARRFLELSETHILTRWMEGFYPIYGVAQSAFGVNWLLLASIHMQESAFSTAPGIYRGLNFAGCCGGPMQFNVTNGPLSTWQLVADSYRHGKRPSAYDHMTSTHPSIYDDFDSIMAAAHLLSSDGAAAALDEAAWHAAYDYYGHDVTGVTYADQVLARAISWSQHGFCVNCGVEAGMVGAVHAAYGAPVLRALLAAQPARASHAPRR